MFKFRKNKRIENKPCGANISPQLVGQIKSSQRQVDLIKSEIADIRSVLKRRDDQVDLMENAVKFLLDEAGYRLYEIKLQDGQTWALPFFFDMSEAMRSGEDVWEDEPLYDTVSLDDLGKLGDYKIITIGKKKYAIAKRKKEKKGKKK